MFSLYWVAHAIGDEKDVDDNRYVVYNRIHRRDVFLSRLRAFGTDAYAKPERFSENPVSIFIVRVASRIAKSFATLYAYRETGVGICISTKCMCYSHMVPLNNLYDAMCYTLQQQTRKVVGGFCIWPLFARCAQMYV